MDAIILAHDSIWTSRDDVNILYPYGHGPADWNNHYPGVKRRKREQSIHDYLRVLVNETIARQRPGWHYRIESVTIREGNERGSYHWTAWGQR